MPGPIHYRDAGCNPLTSSDTNTELDMDSLPNRLTSESPEVIYSDGGFLAVDDAMVSLLKDRAANSPRRRCRLCFHADQDAAQQEMLIVMHQTSYVRPHRHFDKVETLGVIEGSCDLILFGEDGSVTDMIAMSPPRDDGCFFTACPMACFIR